MCIEVGVRTRTIVLAKEGPLGILLRRKPMARVCALHKVPARDIVTLVASATLVTVHL